MAISEAYNMDCLEYMRTLPDNAFDLCIADPPYGDATSKTDQVDSAGCGGGNRSITASDNGLIDIGVSRTGGTWAAKYGKK